EQLLARGADPNAESSEAGFTPLHYALRGQHRDVVELLLARGADVKRNAPLTVAVQTGNLGLVDLLIAKGADVRAPYFRSSPLQAACWLGNPEIVRLLIDHGADPKKADEGCLHLAALRGHRDVVEMLLRRGADVNAEPADGFDLYFGMFQRRPE